MDHQEPLERREVRYRGRVQGVGFRYTARSIAQSYAVTGYVKNVADGSVELVVEGRAGGRFLRAAGGSEPNGPLHPRRAGGDLARHGAVYRF